MIQFLLSPWFNLLCPSFFGIGMGPTSGEYKEARAMEGVGAFGTSKGEEYTTASGDFWKSVLGGDPSQLARVLGPAYSGISQRGQQQLQSLSQFSGRGGGTGAAQQRVGEEMRSEASGVEGQLLGSAATNLGNMGGGLLSTGLSADEAGFNAEKTIQEQKAAKMNDIFKSIADVATTLMPGGAFAKLGSKAFGKIADYSADSGQGPGPSESTMGQYSSSGQADYS